MTVGVKICGLTDEQAVTATAKGEARWGGFVFFPRSPRALSTEKAADLATELRKTTQAVGVFVNPDTPTLENILARVPLDMIQLHGGESPERVQEIRKHFERPVMKAIPISEKSDLDHVSLYDAVADWLLFDARPPTKADRPGGNAVTFNWQLLKQITPISPWILAGGLTLENIDTAVYESGAQFVDVSSGVEKAPGKKDPARIEAFLQKVRALTP